MAISLGQTLGKGLDGIKVEPLVDGVELSTAPLHHLLGHDATKDGGHGGEISHSLVSEELDDLLVELSVVLVLVLDGTSQGKHLCGISLVSGARVRSLLLLEGIEGLEGNVELDGALELGKVGEEELPRVGKGLTQGFLEGKSGLLKAFFRGHRMQKRVGLTNFRRLGCLTWMAMPPDL